MEPSAGELACKAVGPGRLADPERIYSRILDVFLPNDYFGKKVVVTAGPTREPMDPVRFISNPSSGKMGYALARAAAGRGAHVILVSGPTEIEVPDRVHHVRVETAQEMAEAVFAEADSADMIIKVAAVSDYRPVEVARHKVKKGQERITLELEKTTDILAALAQRKRAGQILVGFAAETRDLKENAVAKLAAKKLDMIAANLIGGADSGFRTDTNHIRLFYKDGKSEQLPLMDKEAAAHVLLDRIITLETA